MDDKERLLELAQSISDNDSVDWDELDSSSAGTEDEKLVSGLRTVAAIASFHRQQTGGGALFTGTLPDIEQWGHLEILEKIGEGSFGSVYRAWEKRLERQVALKLIHQELSLKPDSRQQMLKEGQMLARVQHPNVVTVYGIDERDDRLGLWMEFIEGQTLQDQLESQGPLGGREAALVGIDLCRAVAAVHNEGLIHRDIKAQNVMREDGGRIVLMDFGLGGEQLTEKLAVRPKVLSGTPLYMAPELLRGEPATRRSDIYALGVLLYHLVSGTFPVKGSSPSEIRQGHESGEFGLLRDVRADLPETLIQTIEQAIAGEPADRPTTVGQVERALQSTLGLHAGAPSSTAPASIEVRRNWLLPTVALTAILLLVAIALIYWPQPAPVHLSYRHSALVTLASTEQGARLSPDGKWVAFRSDRDRQFQIWVQPVSGSGQTPRGVETPPGRIYSHLWMPDGNRLIYILRRGNDYTVQTASAFSTAPTEVLLTLQAEDISVAPALISLIDDRLYLYWKRQLWRCSLASATPELAPLASPEGVFSGDQLHVRPDERKVLFSRENEGAADLWMADLNGGNEELLTRDSFRNRRPRWIRAGEQWGTIYTSNRSGQNNLWVLFSEGGSSRELTSSPSRDLIQDASPDGSIVVYQSNNQSSNLYRLDPATDVAEAITDDSLGDFLPSTCQGNLVAYQRLKPNEEQGFTALNTALHLGKLEGNRLTDSRNIVAQGFAPMLSPDCRWLAYLRIASPSSLTVMELNTQLATVLSQDLHVFEFLAKPLYWGPRNVLWRAQRLMFVERPPDGPVRIREVDVASGTPQIRTLAESPADVQSLYDLKVSPNNGELSFVERTSSAEKAWRLVRLNLANATRTVQVLEGTHSRVHNLGWLQNRPLIGITTPNPDDSPLVDLELLILGSQSARSLYKLTRLDGALSLLDRGNRKLYFTSQSESFLWNISALSLDRLTVRQLTRNSLRSVIFSGLELTVDGLIFYSQEDHSEDFWLLTLSD